MMPKPLKAGRQVTWFEDGDLWCADDATPPVSPAGWYVRPPGTAVAWIGPFATSEAAEAAPSGGDSFMAARRRLDAWRRATSRQGPGQTEALPSVPADPAKERGRAEDRPPPVEPGPPRQLTLALEESPGAAVAAGRPVRRSRRRRRTEASQPELPFRAPDLGPVR